MICVGLFVTLLRKISVIFVLLVYNGQYLMYSDARMCGIIYTVNALTKQYLKQTGLRKQYGDFNDTLRKMPSMRK